MSKIFPIIDHLYIYQILEYNSWEFLKWFLKNPFKRNLQKKHQLVWTNKAKLLLIFSLPGFIPPLSLFSPVFLIISHILIWPLEYYQKQKILSLTKDKLAKLPNFKIVGITGSFGKTSTKDMLYTLLWKKFYVVKTPKSFNTPLGIAQTILSDLKQNTQVFICEMGAYKKGEIAKICKLIKPDISMITAIAPQHLEKFGSIENIARAKFEIVENLKENGISILNNESDWLKTLACNLKGCHTNFYGMGSQYFASNIKVTTSGTSFIFHTPKATTQISIPLIGEHHAKNFVAAAVAALNLGLTLSEIKDRAKLLLPTPHRMEIKKMGNMILIDNSFNTNPKSAESSLKLLDSFEDSRKIIITPGFVELGKEAPAENQKFGQEIACIADEIIVVGENAKKDILNGIKNVNPSEETIHFVNSTQESIQLAQKLAQEHIERIARYDTKVVVLLENDLPDQYS